MQLRIIQINSKPIIWLYNFSNLPALICFWLLDINVKNSKRIMSANNVELGTSSKKKGRGRNLKNSTIKSISKSTLWRVQNIFESMVNLFLM